MRRHFNIPLLPHAILDNASLLDSEQLDYRDAAFERELRSDMVSKSLDDLRKHYPELTFARVKGGKKEKGHAFSETREKVHTYADWRTSPLQ